MYWFVTSSPRGSRRVEIDVDSAGTVSAIV